MSRIRANTITNLTIDGPPTVSTGLQVTGVTTSTSFTATTSTLVGSAVTLLTKSVDGFLKTVLSIMASILCAAGFINEQ